MTYSTLNARPACRDAAAAFPLFDLPAEAVELVLGFVDDLEDKRALRLVCKRARASVDSRVVAVYVKLIPAYDEVAEQQLSALVRAPWRLQRLYLGGRWLGASDAASLAAARWPALQELSLHRNGLGPAGAASLAAAHLPALQVLSLSSNYLGPAEAASLAAAHWPALQKLSLDWNSLGPAGAAALAAAHWPALQDMWLVSNIL